MTPIIINPKHTTSHSKLTTKNICCNLCTTYSTGIQPTIKLEKMEKMENNVIHIPTFDQYNYLLKYNYNIIQLKSFATYYKLKVSGVKQQLVTTIYTFLYLSNSIVKIQKLMRGCLQRKCNLFHGPAFKNKSECTNAFDFLTMENLKDIPNDQFFSYKDEDKFMYGFDILSLHNLIFKCDGLIKNPFTQKIISSNVINDLRSLLRVSRVLKINICTEIQDVTQEISHKKSIELRALSLFQNIDALGNYSNSSWFMNLNRNELIKMLKNLIDIWSYRASLTIEVKKAICPPLGNPFNRLYNYECLWTIENLDDVRKYILEILEKFVNTGIDKDNKCLGAYYVLSALTLVSEDASTSLPWLFQAVSYM
jgi:hypothetical protein